MATTLTTNQTGANSDYMRYVSGQVQKTDKTNSPDLLDFTLVNYDNAMVKLQRGAHIVLTTDTYGAWFSGYITNDPSPVYLGTVKNQPIWQWSYEATGEEYLLNLKPLGITAPFTNTTQGAIIKALINQLTPEGVTFDLSSVQDGLQVPQYLVNPNQHFSDVIGDLTKASHYIFRCRNFVVTYEAQDSVEMGIQVDGSSEHFTPSNLQMTPSGDPIINDSIILGSLEPQNYMEEYFMGDGATAQFPLQAAVYGVDSTLLLQDDMSSNQINTQYWTVYDSTAGYLQPYGGTLNVLGGNNNGSLDVSLQSISLIPIQGSLRCTHGEWDFISASDGVLGGLWTGQTNGSFTGLMYGIRAIASGANTTLYPQVGASADDTQSVPIDYNKRYVMRTMYDLGEIKRFQPTAAYRSPDGGIHVIGTPVPAAQTMTASTVITELDPLTGVMTNQWTWTTNLGAVSAQYAYYVPVASNNLNLTVSSITVSVPMQVKLYDKAAGTSTWKQQIVGPNEIDTLDGLAPAATVVDSNNGAQTRSSLLGTPNYNPGQATLTYFKETAQLISYLPNVGDIIRCSYRQAGAAIGRAQSKASIATEAAGWGDDGIRSETKSDCNPLPRTSAECELVAVARVNDNCYQHWTGTYQMPSGSWFTSEPLSGTILKFVNLPAQFPTAIQAEDVSQVTSTLVSIDPTEVFQHSISFGPISTIEKALDSVKSTQGVFYPQDTAEIPNFIDVTAIGLTTIDPVPDFVYTGQDSSNWHFTFSTPPAYGVEIRYTDSGWGPDNGNNLIQRLSAGTTTFTVPRTVRGKSVFMRQFDRRNYAYWSENLTQWPLQSAVTPTLVKMGNIENEPSMISKIVFGSSGGNIGMGSTTVGTSGTTVQCEVSFDFMAASGVTTAARASDNGSETVDLSLTGTGTWHRYTIPFTSSTGDASIAFLGPQATFYINRVSIEVGTAVETQYYYTANVPYGVNSRFSTGIHTALPLIPPAPTAVGNFTQIEHPVVSVVLPADLSSVWGVEVRAADNMTVLFKTDLDNATLSLPTDTGDTSMVLQATPPALTKRAFSYYVYTYNLFGEYSAPYLFAGTLPPPSVTNIDILPNSKMVTWSGNAATAYEVYFDKTDATLQNLSFNGTTVNTFMPMSDDDFFGFRYVAVTPYDALGPGVTMGGYFWYLPNTPAFNESGVSYSAPPAGIRPKPSVPKPSTPHRVG